jgi:hypothetical protein
MRDGASKGFPVMDDRLQALWDHHEIRQLLAEYCHGCDRWDAERMASVYAEASWDDHGSLKCDGREFASESTRTLADTYEMVSHLLGQSIIKVDGDQAAAETYFFCVLRRNSSGGRIELDQLGGRYVDRLTREDGRWKIKQRVCVRDWSASHGLDEDALAGHGFAPGGRWRSDPGSTALGYA